MWRHPKSNGPLVLHVRTLLGYLQHWRQVPELREDLGVHPMRLLRGMVAARRLVPADHFLA